MVYLYMVQCIVFFKLDYSIWNKVGLKWGINLRQGLLAYNLYVFNLGLQLAVIVIKLYGSTFEKIAAVNLNDKVSEN